MARLNVQTSADIIAELRALGFEDDADDLRSATTAPQERAAIGQAINAIAGYTLALFRHWKALGHTSAAMERNRLQELNEALLERLIGLSPDFHTEKSDFEENDKRMSTAMRKAQEEG
jgi:hypothetical protein